jgi:maleate isomerase
MRSRAVSYVRGCADDAELQRRLETRPRGIPVVIFSAAAVAALEAPGATRLALVSPPWFSLEMDRQGARYFHTSEFDVVWHGCAELPSDQQAIRPDALFEWVRTHTPERAQLSLSTETDFAPWASSRR